MPSIKDFKVGSQWNASGEPVYKLPEWMNATATPVAPVTTPLVAPQVAPSNAPPNPLQKAQDAPQITLPEMFQPNYQMGPQQQAQQGIKMPNIKKPLQGFGGGSNWTDFLTVANNRYTR